MDDFLNTKKFLESNNENFVFSENYNLIIIFLNVIPFCNSSEEVIDFVLFHNRSVLKESESNQIREFLTK